MNRKIMLKLTDWKDSVARKPLLIYGARQVGKTHTLREFGEAYFKNVVYLNFETNPRARGYFEDGIEPERLVRLLETETGDRIIAGETLVIFDEIQSCERALTSLKYFNENAPEFHVAGAGSLLGVAINRERYSFPVGNVDSVTMFPLDFEEFLWAAGQERLCNLIKESFASNAPLNVSLHEKALELYRLYLVVGGMPAAVACYFNDESLLPIADIQGKIINDYTADMAKYATYADSVKIRAAYESVPVQLAKENKKFQYKLAMKGGTSAIFGAALDWLGFAGLTLKCTRIEHATMPIKAYSDMSSFKLYMSDVGLLTAQSGIAHQTVLSAGEIDNTFLGAITENYVAQALAANRHGLYYWRNEGTAELDFVLQNGVDVVGVEVKTGTRTRSKSLGMFVEKYKPSYTMRLSGKNFGFENGIKSVPLYAAFCV